MHPFNISGALATNNFVFLNGLQKADLKPIIKMSRMIDHTFRRFKNSKPVVGNITLLIIEY